MQQTCFFHVTLCYCCSCIRSHMIYADDLLISINIVLLSWDNNLFRYGILFSDTTFTSPCFCFWFLVFGYPYMNVSGCFFSCKPYIANIPLMRYWYHDDMCSVKQKNLKSWCWQSQLGSFFSYCVWFPDTNASGLKTSKSVLCLLGSCCLLCSLINVESLYSRSLPVWIMQIDLYRHDPFSLFILLLSPSPSNNHSWICNFMTPHSHSRFPWECTIVWSHMLVWSHMQSILWSHMQSADKICVYSALCGCS